MQRPIDATAVPSEGNARTHVQKALLEEVANCKENGYCSRGQYDDTIDTGCDKRGNVMVAECNKDVNFNMDVEIREYVPEVSAQTLDWFNGRVIKLQPLSTNAPRPKSFDVNESTIALMTALLKARELEKEVTESCDERAGARKNALECVVWWPPNYNKVGYMLVRGARSQNGKCKASNKTMSKNAKDVVYKPK